MPVLKGRRANGHPISITLPTGTPPSQVGSLAAGTPTTTTIPVTYTAATGTATISYSGQTSTDGGTTYITNGGTFTGTGGTFTGLSPTTAYRLRIIATNGFLPDSATALAGGAVTTASPAATTYTTSINLSSGLSGSSFSYTVTPGAGGWPSGEVITPTVTGGSVSPTSATGSGTTPVVFTVTATGSGGTNCVVNSTAPGMTNLTGGEQFAITSPATPTGQANRFDARFDQSAAAPGTARTITLDPNGLWPSSGTITPAASKGSGTFSPTSATLAGGSTPITFSYTPSAAGEHAVSFTAPAGLFTPWPAPLNCWTPSSGTARTIAATSTLLDLAGFQYDSLQGVALGFSYTSAKGWAEVVLNVSAISGSTNGLWVKLNDSLTGNALQSTPVQVYGPISASGNVTILIPADLYIKDLLLATDAAFTNPVQVAQRIKTGLVLAVNGRSFECGIARMYAYGAGSTAGINSPTTTVNITPNGGYNTYGDSHYIFRQELDGNTWDLGFGISDGTSPGACEFGRLVAQALGVTLTITGAAQTGGNMDGFINSDGSFTDGMNMVQSCREKFRWYWAAHNDGYDDTYSTFISVIANNSSYTAGRYKACAVHGFVYGASGVFGGDGSRNTGYTRVSCGIRAMEASNQMLVAKDNYAWNNHDPGGHASSGAKIQFARTGFRQLMSRELQTWGGWQTRNCGPTIGNATRSGNTVTVPFTQHGGSSLLAVGTSTGDSTNTFDTASGAELAALFALRNFGGRANDGTTTVYSIDSATVSGSNVILNVTPGQTLPNPMTLHYACDFGVSNPAIQNSSNHRAAMICDERVDNTLGIPFGWHASAAVDLTVAGA